MEKSATDEPGKWVNRFLAECGPLETGAAVLALLAFVFVWRISLLASLGLAVGVYFGVAMLLPARSPDRFVIEARTKCEFEAGARVACIEQETVRMGMSAARLRLPVIIRTANSILADLNVRPQHLSEARFAFDALLDATVMALDRYQKFSRSGTVAAQRGRDVLENRIFPTIDRGFQQLLEKLLQDDLRALSVDAAVLEHLLELEGLSGEERVRDDAERNAGAQGREGTNQITGANPAGTGERSRK
jgi:hypothetical protein